MLYIITGWVSPLTRPRPADMAREPFVLSLQSALHALHYLVRHSKFDEDDFATLIDPPTMTTTTTTWDDGFGFADSDGRTTPNID